MPRSQIIQTLYSPINMFTAPTHPMHKEKGIAVKKLQLALCVNKIFKIIYNHLPKPASNDGKVVML